MLLWCNLTVTSWQSEYYGEQHAYSQSEGVIQIRYDLCWAEFGES